MLKELSLALSSGQKTSRELVGECLSVIRERNPELNALTEVYSEEAAFLARESDERRRRGCSQSPLDGIPFVYKDNLLWKGHRAECASRMLRGWTAPYTSTAVERLLLSGMIPLGRANMDEFAMGARGEFALNGPVRNPRDSRLCAGGSSAGSAAAVASGMAPCALGTDTGGSLRIPAAWCGVTGVKPAWGTVSRWGLVAFASSLDCVGVLAPSPEDCALLMDRLSGPDGRDQTCGDGLYPGAFSLPERPVIGVIRGDWPEPVCRALELARDRLTRAGVSFREEQLPDPEGCAAAYFAISSAEASSNLARFDGVRYGYRSAASASSPAEAYRASRGEGFGPEVKRRLMIGAHALTRQELYPRAGAFRQRVREEMNALFARCQVLLTPATAQLPPRIGTFQPLDSFRSDELAIPASLAGLPSVSVPVTVPGQAPVGLALTGPADSLAALLRLGQILYREDCASR